MRTLVNDFEQNGESKESAEHNTPIYTPRSDLGRRLMAIRERIVRSGAPLLDRDGVEREVTERRGAHP